MKQDYQQTAALVLAKCAANDPWFPNGGEALVLAWAEVFSKTKLDQIDLVEGVALAYEENGSGFKPLPADIVKYGRLHYGRALDGLTPAQRDDMDETAYALMDQGYPPPDAHRFSRAAALGRPTELDLTEEDVSAIQRRIDTARSLASRFAQTIEQRRLRGLERAAQQFGGKA